MAESAAPGPEHPAKDATDAELLQKRVAFYEACVGAWINTRLEVDKALMSISVAATGGIIALWTQATLTAPWQLWTLMGAFMLFLVTVVLVLVGLTRSSDLAKLEATDKPVAPEFDEELDYLDKAARASMVLGLMLAGAAAFGIAYAKLNGGAK